MSKQPPPAPTARAVGPCPTVIQIVGRPGTGSLPSTIAPPDHPRLDRNVTDSHTNTCRLCKKTLDARQHLSEHVRGHLSAEYLTLSQVRRLRKQVGGSIVNKISTDPKKRASPKAGLVGWLVVLGLTAL